MYSSYDLIHHWSRDLVSAASPGWDFLLTYLKECSSTFHPLLWRAQLTDSRASYCKVSRMQSFLGVCFCHLSTRNRRACKYRVVLKDFTDVRFEHFNYFDQLFGEKNIQIIKNDIDDSAETSEGAVSSFSGWRRGKSLTICSIYLEESFVRW